MNRVVKSGDTPYTHFNYLNGNQYSGTAPFVSNDLGGRWAIRIDRNAGDNLWGGVCRTQMGGLYETSGAVHNLAAYANQQVWYGIG
jgi:hypothetical protein